jgi:hypothetical protein
MWYYGLNSSGLGQEQVLDSYEHGDKTFGFHNMLVKSRVAE